MASAETWWDLYINAMGYVLEANNSWGGTNDAWAGSPIGEYQYEGWTKEDCKSFRPALACLFDQLRRKYPQAQIYSILNSELREEINESSRTICKHYGIQLIELHDIEKQTRKILKMPPFGKLASVIVSGIKQKEVEK